MSNERFKIYSAVYLYLDTVEIVVKCHSDRANQTPKRLVREWRNLFIKPNLVLSTDPSATLGMTKKYYFNRYRLVIENIKNRVFYSEFRWN
ncbi:MAG: hypothetical protein V1655_03030 [bacterium]